jgi:hypothetical protein
MLNIKYQERGSWYRSDANCRTPISGMFLGIFEIYRDILKFVFIYSMICRGIPDDVRRNRGWETLVRVYS